MAQAWQIEIAHPARKELSRLPTHMQSRISRAILTLEADPFPHGCKKLQNRDGWRIRVGDYRILYFVNTKTHHVIVGVIGHRREVYRG
jgi:mRNA interferase RelE/StbE